MPETSRPVPDNAARNWGIALMVVACINIVLFVFDTHLKKQIIDAIREAQDLVYKLETLGGVSSGSKAPGTVSGRTRIPASTDPSVRTGDGGSPMVDALPRVEETGTPNEAGKSRAEFIQPSSGANGQPASRRTRVRKTNT